MSRNAELSTSTQDPAPEITASTRMSVAVIGPNAAHRRVVAKALTGSEARTVREFIDYPAKLTDIQRLMEQQHFDVVMIDVDSDQSYALQVVQKFAAIENVMVMVYSMRNDQNLLRSCLEAGARDFLPLPADADAEAERPASTPSGEPPRVAQTPSAVASVPSEVQRPIQPADILKGPVPSSEGQRGTPLAADFIRTAPSPMPDILRTPPTADQETAKASSFSEDFYRQPLDLPDNGRAAGAGAVGMNPPPGSSVAEQYAAPAPRNISSATDPAGAFRALPASAPANTPAPDAGATDFTAWDNAWIRATQPAPSASEEAKPGPGDAAALKPPTGRLLGNAQKTTSALSRAEKNQTEAPTFRGVETRDEAASAPNWKKWCLIGAIPVVLIVVASLVFMRPSHPAAPEAQPAEPETQQPQAVEKATEASPDVPAPNIAKPSPAAPLTEPKATDSTPAKSVSPDMMDAQLSAPSRIAGRMKKTDPVEDAPPSSFTPGAIEAGGSVPGAVFGKQQKVNVVPAISAISAGVAEGMLLHKNPPIYPQFAKEAHMSGTVVLGASITRAGNIEGLHVISGPEIFREPALQAVRTWRYRPYKLNNQPVEVETTIKVIFSDQR
jgi:periplasmic protein TonB